MELGDIILIGAGLWAAYKAGQLSIILPVARMIKQQVEEGKLDPKLLEDDPDTEERVTEDLVRFERVNDCYYAYAEASGQFLAQGKTFLELFQTIKSRFPNRDFRVNKVQAELTDEEVGRMVQSIFQVFGDKNNDKANTSRQ